MCTSIFIYEFFVNKYMDREATEDEPLVHKASSTDQDICRHVGDYAPQQYERGKKEEKEKRKRKKRGEGMKREKKGGHCVEL